MRFQTSLHALLAAAALLMLVPATQTQELSPLARVEALDLGTTRVGRVTTYHAADDVERAEELAALTERIAAFYQTELGISFEGLRLAVLQPEHWFSPYPTPYAIPWPSISERLILMPASLERSVLIQGPDPQADRRRIDFILLHEFGHIAAKEYYHPTSTADDLPFDVAWFNELLATYFACGFLDATDPEWLDADRPLWRAQVEGFTPAQRTLDWSFMRDLSPEDMSKTYAWYQYALNLRAADLHAEHGLGFLRAVRKGLAWEGADSWTTATLLPQLELVAPGFERWAVNLTGHARSPAEASQPAPTR